ncbi:hypothetical protein ACFFQW_15665 [Umezawaea endophytica]|uniref:Uncharacterized protein n=1 Tax=Umezawaea endophytica TaxID=1654476 RepID=A0A9X2VFW0_9PSEU|nr:hypothetical protein [Umezawaea endophytica]MCS7475389.1 hypothetical protein [Umezawaea endophytica]
MGALRRIRSSVISATLVVVSGLFIGPSASAVATTSFPSNEPSATFAPSRPGVAAANTVCALSPGGNGVYRYNGSG